MGNPSSLTLSNLIAKDGRVHSNNYSVSPTLNTSYLFEAMYRPSAAALPLTAYWPDTRSKNIVQNYNNAYTGLAWSQPLWGFMGDGPKLYEIVEAPAGLTLSGEVTRNANGYFVPDSTYANLFWTTPIAGVHRVIIRVTDQRGDMVILDWFLTVGTLNHHFMALVATGNGSGSSPANYATYATTFPGATTVSPSKGKVIHVKGDDFPAAGSSTSMNTTYTAASMVAMPGETATLRQKIVIGSNDIHLHGIIATSVVVSSFGVVDVGSYYNRVGLWRCKFINCTKTGGTANQCCFGASSLGDGDYRERIFISECDFINCGTLHGYDVFNVRDMVFARNRYSIDNGQTFLDASWIFPKNAIISAEIVFNTADVPSLTTSSAAVVQLYNSWEPTDLYCTDVVCKFENNFIRTGGADCIDSNGSANPTTSAMTITNFLKRNTFVGGRVTMQHYIGDLKPERITYLESNVIQNISGGVTIPAGGSSSSWYQVSGTNVYGTVGVVDLNGYLVNTTNRGKTGHGIWRPE